MLENRERLAREAVRKTKKNAPMVVLKGRKPAVPPRPHGTGDIETLVALAREGDKDALEILREVCTRRERTRMNVPADLHEFVWEWFIDGPPKAKSGTSPKDTELKYTTIALLVKIG